MSGEPLVIVVTDDDESITLPVEQLLRMCWHWEEGFQDDCPACLTRALHALGTAIAVVAEVEARITAARAEGAAKEREACWAVIAELVASEQNTRSSCDSGAAESIDYKDKTIYQYWAAQARVSANKIAALAMALERIRARGNDTG